MSEGRIVKPDKDFTSDVDKQLPEAQEQAKNGNVSAAVEKLSLLEKHTRQASDLASTSRVLVGIVTICKDELHRRHSQHRDQAHRDRDVEDGHRGQGM